ncbi:MAG: phosphoserine phosphatase SerB [Alphaproteobacteria bacterium]|nr:MAG: phosphoserine phosphatase SerB [Alphaproteobacteria bacterium]
MRFVLTVIGAPGSSLPNAGLVEAAGTALAGCGHRPGPPDWLAPEEACDIPFELATTEPEEAGTGDILSAVRAQLAGAPVDLAILPTAGRRKALLVADMESTVIGQEMIDELAEIAGIGPHIAAITARAMAGELDFTAALRERVALLRGLSVAALERAARRITIDPGARTLVQTMRAHGAWTALVSGGFDYFASVVGRACGFDEIRANRLLLADGMLSGTVAEPVLDRDAKLATLHELAKRRGVKPAASCAVGDGANDLAMIRAAGLGVAYRGKPLLRAAADACIDHGDLSALLYLQGYRKNDFRT